jgi:hypothetical protein
MARQLFGGAIQAAVPAEFADISGLRQVPDNQEVFAHAETDRSLIFDLLESEGDVPAADGAPALFHWHVLARDSGAISSAVTHSRSIPLERMAPALAAGDPRAHVSVAYGVQHVAKFKDAAAAANAVRVCLACVRLPRASTDVLIAFNDPVAMHPASSSAKFGSAVASPAVRDEEERSAVLHAALTSLAVNDWSLFR